MHGSVEKRKEQIVETCRRFDVRRLSVFGSAARGTDFDPGRSDVDLIVDLGPLREDDPFMEFKEAMERVLGRRVDLVDAPVFERDQNYIRTASISRDIEVIYERA